MSSIWTLIFFSGSNSCSLDWFNNHRCHLSWSNSHRCDHWSHCNRSDSWSANLNNFLSYIHRINLTCIVYNSYIRLWSWWWRIVWTSSIIINLNIGIMMDVCLIILNSSCVVGLRWTVGIRCILILLWLVFKMIKIALNWNFRAHRKEETRLPVEPDQFGTFSERSYLIDYKIDCCTDFKKVHTQNSTLSFSMLTFPIIQKLMRLNLTITAVTTILILVMLIRGHNSTILRIIRHQRAHWGILFSECFYEYNYFEKL